MGKHLHVCTYICTHTHTHTCTHLYSLQFQAIMDHHTEYAQLCVRELSVDAEKESHSNKALHVKDKAKEVYYR